MKILHYIGSLHYAGAQTFLMELYRNIDRDNFQFDFVVFPEDECGFYDEVKEYGGMIYVCPKFNGLNYLEFVKWWNAFLAVHSVEYSTIHIHQTVTARMVIKASRKHGIPTILHSHSKSNGSGLVAKLKDMMQFNLGHMADYMYACSDEAGQYLFGPNVIGKNNYETLQNAIDISRFEYNEHVRKKLRLSLNIEDKYVLGVVGRFHHTKNQIFLINLLPEIVVKVPNVMLMLVGDGDERVLLERRAAELGVTDNVLFVGNKRNTEDYYQCMDLFVMPSLHEGFGIVALEAQASGLHCLLSSAIPKSVNVTGNVEFLDLIGNCWTNAIYETFLCSERARCENIEALYRAGFDSKELAKRIEKKYYELNRMVR